MEMTVVLFLLLAIVLLGWLSDARTRRTELTGVGLAAAKGAVERLAT
jgi:hypothetical protein